MDPKLTLAIITFLLPVPALCTAGAVLLIKFWAGRLRQSLRVFIAAAIGPIVVIGLLVVAGSLRRGLTHVHLLGVAVAMLIPILVVGLPIAYFATRKLDRLLAPTATIFE